MENGALSINHESELCVGKNIHESIPHIPAPGPKIGPDFLKEERVMSLDTEKVEKETNKEKLERIKEIILDTDIDILGPAKTYRQLAQKLKNLGLYDDELKIDVNYYFNQKLQYCIDKENVKSGAGESKDSMKSKKEAAAFVGAKNLHDIVEKLERIEESGGNDEKIKEYWNSRQAFYLNLKEKDIEHLLSEEEMLLDSLQHSQKYGALAEKAARNLMKNSYVYLQEIAGENESLKKLFVDGLKINIKEASINDDVYSCTDFYFEVVMENKVKSFPVQIKCGSIDARRGQDEITQDFILNNLVNVIDNKENFRCRQDSCYYEKKMTEKMNKFIKKALVDNKNEKGFFIILPRGKGMLHENGDVDENVKKMFFEQFAKEIVNLELNQ